MRDYRERQRLRRQWVTDRVIFVGALFFVAFLIWFFAK